MPTVNDNERIQPDSPVTWANIFGNSGTRMNTPRLDVTLTYGKINMSASSLNITALRANKPWIRDSAINTAQRVRNSAQFTPSTNSPVAIGGGFSTERVSHLEGTIILLIGVLTRRRIRHANAAVFVRLRRDAGMMLISAKLPTAPESLLGDRLPILQGNADVLTLEELKMFDIAVPPSWANGYMKPDEIADVFDVQEISQGSPKPSLQKVVSNGKVVMREVAQEPVRRIIRRR